jgi:aryl-alcohol dehydrogenase-like predicted oxidoreductase
LIGDFDRRPLGQSGVALSPITLGTMRLDRAEDQAGLLAHAFQLGITSLHCSSEYETYSAFCDAFREVRSGSRDDLAVIAKVAAPHFGENRFSPAQFRGKVHYYLDTLGIDRLDVVQWLLRYDLAQEEARGRIFDEAASELTNVISDLKAEGLIGACVGFPYSREIARRLVGAEFIDGLAVYVNALEHEMDDFVAAAAVSAKSTVAIRPFCAGAVFADAGLSYCEALDYVFGLPGIATTIVSASSPTHLEQLRSAFV